jgi:hypothetical protein
MITNYTKKLINNLPKELKNKKKPIKLDLVLDGGVFNGSYLFGALYFLKEMENQNYMCIERISGSSVGSIAGLIYFMDCLDYYQYLYKIVINDFKKTYNLKIITQLYFYLKDKMPENICERVNGKFFITYYDIKKGKKIIKSKFSNAEDLVNTVINSCFLPFLIDGNMLNNNRYIDGLNPYCFDAKPHKKILYLDLFGMDKIKYLFNVKNENTTCHRILNGLLDIHEFFIKQTSTSMCSFVSEWSFYDNFKYNIKLLLEYIIVFIVYFIGFVRKYFKKNMKKYGFYKLLSTFGYKLYILLLKSYCL